MSNGATVQTGPGLSPEDEAAHRQRLAEQAADEAEQAVATIEAKLAGMKESLATAKADAKRLRAEAKEGRD
jgi:multidrug resistance efflux pump